MAIARITKRAVDALACPADKDRIFLWDESLSGFGVCVFNTGRKIYVAQYRNGHSRKAQSRRYTLGEHGKLTPDEARLAAKKILGAVANGADPLAQRKTASGIPTFRDLADAYMAQHVRKHRKPRTAEAYETLLRLHVLPALGSMRVTDIKRSHVASLHEKMADLPGAANRALSVFNAVWTWAATKTYSDLGLPMSPAKGIERNQEDGRERFLTSEELARLGEALARAETEGLPYQVDESGSNAKHAAKPENRLRRIDPFAIAAIRLLLFTGARLREILHARWDEIDFERGLLNLSRERSKTGKKSIYLSAAALEVLTSLPQIDGNPHVIPGEGMDEAGLGRPRTDLKAPWRAITEAAALEGLRLHDLRHSFASIGVGASLGLPIIGKLLGHTQPTTTARYAHLDADPMRKAANTIGAAISAAMKGTQGAEVVGLKRPAR